MSVIDVRRELPLADWEIGRFGPKTSATVHWNGPAIPDDVDPLELILGDAHYHLSKDWSPEPGIQGADGIQYHELIARSGDVYITRDPDAVLWHCADPMGNHTSRAIQVMVGEGQQATSAQLASLAARIVELGLDDVRPHRSWSATACPGNELATWVYARGWEGVDMDKDTFKVWFLEVYKTIGVAATFDEMKEIQKEFAEQLRKIQAGEQLEKSDIDALKARIDRIAIAAQP